MTLAHVFVIVLSVSVIAFVDAVVSEVHVAVAQRLCRVGVSEAKCI